MSVPSTLSSAKKRKGDAAANSTSPAIPESSSDSLITLAYEHQFDALGPKENERVLYWGSGSPQAWRVLIALEEKDICYRSVLVSLSSGILKHSFFKTLNPRQRIPIFVDGTTGAVLYESLAIIEYLEHCYKSRKLMPEHPVQYATAQTHLHESNEILSAIGEMIFYLRKVPKARQNHQVLTSKWHAVEKECQYWESYLATSGSGYLISGALGPYLCDIVLFTNMAYAIRCGLKVDGVYPHLAAFYQQMCARPAVDRTWPPHWRTTCGQPVLSSWYNLPK